MSRIGIQPILIPQGVTVTADRGVVKVKGPKGELTFAYHPNVSIQIEKDVITVSRKSDEKFDRALHGTTRKLIANMVEGVTKGFSKSLEIQGVGYRGQVQGKKLVLSLGFSHPLEYPIPEGITITFDQEKKNIFTVSGIDKQKVSQVAAVIRGFRKPEPYKGKGIRYVGEVIQKKVGKAAATGATAKE